MYGIKYLIFSYGSDLTETQIISHRKWEYNAKIFKTKYSNIYNLNA